MKKYRFILKNLDCANCALKIQERIASLDVFDNVIVNFSTLRLSFETSLEDDVKARVTKIVKEIEPEVEVLDVDQIVHENSSTKSIIRLLSGIVMAIVGLFNDFPYISEILVITAYIILLYRTFKNAVKLFRNTRSINENLLITISCVGAYLVGEHMEGLMVIILYEIGKILEDKAVSNTRRSIKSLMDIKSEYANLKNENGYLQVTPESLKLDDIIIVKQGEKVPIDGIIVNGNSKLDTSALTGESELREAKVGDNILSGSINIGNVIEIRVTCLYENSTVNKILQLVEDATDNKAKTETFVAKAAKIYTPIVLILAVLTGVLLPLFTNLTYSESIYRALIFLVISCPCAIAISVPLSYFSGIGASSKRGILIKGSDYLDTLSNIKTIVFDKTGTLTDGTFRIESINIYDNHYTEEKILEIASYGESFSNHPIAKSILLKYNKEIDTSNVTKYKEISGQGIEFFLDNKKVLIGNSNFCNYKKESLDGTIIYINYDNSVIGSIVINDGLKESSTTTIKELKRRNIKPLMFTGDNKNIALAIGRKLGIDNIKYELLPTDKYKKLEELINSNNHSVAFVGDGINDAPVLALSDIGISMRNVGSSSAIEASDVVIMNDELTKIIEAIDISFKTKRIIKQNLIFAISTKIIILILSVFGIAGMWQAIFADVGVTLITILNTTRILKK